jgi:hypothetical protein
MKDLFETFTQVRSSNKKIRRSREATQLESMALVDALGGESQRDNRWIDLDHALASGSHRESVSEELQFEPGPLELDTGEDDT